jgi:hypothetical protein
MKTLGWHSQLTATDKAIVKSGSEELLQSTLESCRLARDGITEIMPKCKRVYTLMGEAELLPKGKADKAAMKDMINKMSARMPKLNEVCLQQNCLKDAFAISKRRLNI